MKNPFEFSNPVLSPDSNEFTVLRSFWFLKAFEIAAKKFSELLHGNVLQDELLSAVNNVRFLISAGVWSVRKNFLVFVELIF